MRKRHYSKNLCCDDDGEEDYSPGCEVRESGRNQGEAGFNCSHCGRRIKPREEYYCNVITREFYEYEDQEIVVTPLQTSQVSTWCEDCYEKIFDL